MSLSEFALFSIHFKSELSECNESTRCLITFRRIISSNETS
jgi:hypothetical protein